jgi:hypothetical protein
MIIDALFAKDVDVLTRLARVLSLIECISTPLGQRKDDMPAGEEVDLGGVATIDKEKTVAAFGGRTSRGRDGKTNGSGKWHTEFGGGLIAEVGLLEGGTGCLEVS